MSLSIITPHYNNSEDIQSLYNMLSNQTLDTWQWIIVDDFSDSDQRKALEAFFDDANDQRVNVAFNIEKSNASVCRNQGIELSIYDKLVFLDADDAIAEDFVKNRIITFSDFTIFKNMMVVDQNGTHIPSNAPESNYLDHFLNANFIWQTTSILWDKAFLKKIGGFDINYKRLQDVELAIRALSSSNQFRVEDNPVDFFYKVAPIREKKNFVEPVCSSVSYLVSNTLDAYTLSKQQMSLVKAYYFMCTKYLERSGDRKNTTFVKPIAKLFFTKNYFTFTDRILATVFLKLYKYKLLSGNLFLKFNRYFFKTKVEN